MIMLIRMMIFMTVADVASDEGGLACVSMRLCVVSAECFVCAVTLLSDRRQFQRVAELRQEAHKAKHKQRGGQIDAFNVAAIG